MVAVGCGSGAGGALLAAARPPPFCPGAGGGGAERLEVRFEVLTTQKRDSGKVAGHSFCKSVRFTAELAAPDVCSAGIRAGGTHGAVARPASAYAGPPTERLSGGAQGAVI